MIPSPSILIDTTRCTGCEKCIGACKEVNHLGTDRLRPGQTRVDDLSATRFSTILRERGNHFVRQMCRHCLEPACVSACLVGAMQKTPEGPVIYDESLCMGCRYCMLACPYDARYFDEEAGIVDKCTFCDHRVREGREPSCVETCPTRVRHFGNVADTDSEVYRLMTRNRVQRLKEEAGTDPQLRYICMKIKL